MIRLHQSNTTEGTTQIPIRSFTQSGLSNQKTFWVRPKDPVNDIGAATTTFFFDI